MNDAFLIHVGSKCGQIVKALLMASSLLVAEADEMLLCKFKTKKDKTKYLNILEHQQKDECGVTNDDS